MTELTAVAGDRSREERGSGLGKRVSVTFVRAAETRKWFRFQPLGDGDDIAPFTRP